MRNVSSSIALAIASLALIGLTGLAQSGPDPAAKKLKNPVASSSESVAAGQQLYAKYCRFCHGADAKGNGPMAPKGTHPPDLTAGKVLDLTDGEIFATIRDGAGPHQEMKPFKGKMQEQDMWTVVTYLRSIGSKSKP
jgi:mono/diheme cytochrome c family protein